MASTNREWSRGVHPESRPALIDSVRGAVLEAWPEDAHGSLPEVEASLAALASWIRRFQATGEVGDLDDGSDRFLERRLIEALRLETLRQWVEEEEEEQNSTDVLELLRALEEVSRALLPKDARDLASRLADPDGFELLVEVAHDLRSPLTSISFLAEALRTGHSGEINQVQRSQLGLIYSAALGMTSVVSDVMELAHQSVNVVDQEPETFSISELFEYVRKLVQPIAEAKRIDLRFEVPEHERVMGQQIALNRVLLNLVTNAIKFTEEGWVMVAARYVERDTVEFSVRDTGRGIGPAGQSTLYQPFRKSAARKGSFFSGSGLGLSIARRLVRSMGAELEFQTHEGWGTCFYFQVKLPAVQGY